MMRSKDKKRVRVGHFLFSIACLFILLLVLKNSEIAIEYVTLGLKLSVNSVIPSLFPFMVISELIVRSGAASVISRPLARPARALFGVSKEGASVFLLGAICGFPIGARSAVRLYDEGKIDKDELTALMDFSNNPSSAFVISAVGVSLFGNRRLGLLLYVITLLSAVSVGVMRNICTKRKGKGEYAPSCARVSSLKISDFTDSVTSSAIGVINVCAFVVFFSVVVGTLGIVLDSFGAPRNIRALIFSLLEMTGGASAASALSPTILGALLAAFCLGWSGLSVHCQVLSLCGTRIGAMRYVISKLIQGILSVLYLWIYLKIFGDSVLIGAESVTAVRIEFFDDIRAAIVVLFALSLILVITKKHRAEKRGAEA